MRSRVVQHVGCQDVVVRHAGCEDGVVRHVGSWCCHAPAAAVGSLSGIKPEFSVTRHCHGRPIPYRRKLIGQKLE